MGFLLSISLSLYIIYNIYIIFGDSYTFGFWVFVGWCKPKCRPFHWLGLPGWASHSPGQRPALPAGSAPSASAALLVGSAQLGPAHWDFWGKPWWVVDLRLTTDKPGLALICFWLLGKFEASDLGALVFSMPQTVQTAMFWGAVFFFFKHVHTARHERSRANFG